MWVLSLGWEDHREKRSAPSTSVPAWRAPGMEEHGGHSPWGHREPDVAEQENYLPVEKVEILFYQN